MKLKILIFMLCTLNTFIPFPLDSINKNTIDIISSLNMENISIESCLKLDDEELNKATIVWANSNVNIRMLPSKDSEKIGYLEKGKTIKRLNVLDNGWSKVLLDDKICFINSSYLSETKIEIENNEFAPLSKGINIQYIGDCKNIKLIETYSTYIPQNIVDYLNINGWQIVLSTENLAQKHYEGQYSSIQGITLYNEKRIEISDREKAIKNALIHEIGHALDGVFFSSYSTKNDFLSIYNEESQNIKNLEGVNSDDLVSPMEYFAESFKQYITNKESLKKVAPKTYTYMENFITLF